MFWEETCGFSTQLPFMWVVNINTIWFNDVNYLKKKIIVDVGLHYIAPYLMKY